MAIGKRNDCWSFLDRLIAVLLSFPWREVLEEEWKIVRQVMSLNPNAYTDDRRATRFRVTLRSWVAESPVHCDRVCTDYTGKSPLVKHAVEWNIHQGFLKRMEYWETHVTHRTGHLKVNVIFPKSRPPRRATLVESNRQRSYGLGKSAQVPLPDGRWLVTWKTHRPRLYENYILQWQW